MNVLMKKLLFGALALVVVLFTATSVVAQSSNCAPRGEVVKKLTEKFGEVRRGGGIRSQKQAFEIWVSEETGTWTALSTFSNPSNTGLMSCVLSSGTDWIHDMDWINELKNPTPEGDPV